MNILMMSKIFAKSGVGVHIKDLSKQLISMGHNVHLMSGTNDWGTFCLETGIAFHTVDFSLSPVKMIRSLKYIYIYQGA